MSKRARHSGAHPSMRSDICAIASSSHSRASRFATCPAQSRSAPIMAGVRRSTPLLRRPRRFDACVRVPGKRGGACDGSSFGCCERPSFEKALVFVSFSHTCLPQPRSEPQRPMSPSVVRRAAEAYLCVLTVRVSRRTLKRSIAPSIALRASVSAFLSLTESEAIHLQRATSSTDGGEGVVVCVGACACVPGGWGRGGGGGGGVGGGGGRAHEEKKTPQKKAEEG
jgi:hypothetical protein